MIFVSALCFALSVLMYGFSLAHGKVSWVLFMLIGLLFLALSGCTWGWLPRRPPPGQD